MDELVWTPVSPLRAALVPGRHGSESVLQGIVMFEMTCFSLVQVMARRARWARVAKAAEKCFGVVPPSQPRTVNFTNGVLIWSGPDQFLVLGNDTMRGETAPHFAGLASLSGQGDGRVVLAVSGAKARLMLAKVCSLDLHPQAFDVGAAAATSIYGAVRAMLTDARFFVSSCRPVLPQAFGKRFSVPRPNSVWPLVQRIFRPERCEALRPDACG